MNKLVSCLFFFLCISYHAYSQDAVNLKYTLKQCVEIAIDNNLQVRQSELEMMTKEVYSRQSMQNMLPYIEGNFNHGINNGKSIDPFTNTYIDQNVNYDNFNLLSSITLFSGLSIQNSIRQNSLAYQAGKMDLQQAKDNVTLNVILIYLRILNSEDLLDQSGKQAEVSKKQAERLEQLNKVGAIPPAQFYDLKGQLANDELAVISNRTALASSKLELYQLMNIPYTGETGVERISVEEFLTTYETTLEQVYSTALSQMPLIKSAELKKKSTEKGVQALRGEYIPQIFMGANLNTNISSAAFRDVATGTNEVASGDFVDVNGSSYPVITHFTDYKSETIDYNDQFKNNYNASVYIGLRIPILNSFQTKNKVALAKIARKNAEYVNESTKLQVKQSVEQAYINMTSAFERYKILSEQVKDFSESFRQTEARFNSGAITQVDYLAAKNNVDRANINLITARYDFYLRTKILDYYQGRLKL